jgi:predicted nucleic acid-binding protein
MIVVDSSVWVDYFNGRVMPETGFLDELLGRRALLTGDLIVAEVLQGFRTDGDFQQALSLLETLKIADMLGREVAILSARNYRLLRSKGVTVRGTIDVVIATFCILNDHQLLHSDRDFDQMVPHLGLKVATAQHLS